MRSLLRLNKAYLRLVSAYITEHGHLRNHLATVCLLQKEILVADCGQAPESAKYILLECEPLDIRRRRIFVGKHPGIEEVAGLGYRILELVTR